MLKNSGSKTSRYFLYLYILFAAPIIISYSAYASSLGYITVGGR